MPSPDHPYPYELYVDLKELADEKNVLSERDFYNLTAVAAVTLMDRLKEKTKKPGADIPATTENAW